MIVSAVTVLAIVSGSLAFKGANKAYRCEIPQGQSQEVCVLKFAAVDPGGNELADAVTTASIEGLDCPTNCPKGSNIHFTPQN